MARLRTRVQMLGLPQYRRNVRRLKKALYDAAAQHAERESELLFEHSQRIVPYMDGDLMRSGYRRKVTRKEEYPEYAVGYDNNKVPYAWAVHQLAAYHPTRGPYPDPKTDHYLSIPRDALAQTYAARGAVKFNAVIRKFHAEL